ncbi:SpoIIE family protein phosphatase [Kineococcus rhizosphaerae]|uniref:PAS domain S-box-containing protein n=1 Tax=Kineococcus rhizosphaerae TaxID=559628 RepID=A0A2T0R3P4_9ACTN|nr:SpoIIE family protein phosphatase [Kineococcus rhizosphaerae]PRY14664.1 PAS domain S-box-containing protein [Kineococcus rhizosphaerae]
MDSERPGAPPAFADDAGRVRSARRLTSSAPHPALDRLAELAARLLGTDAAQVSLLSNVLTISAATGAAAAPAPGERVTAHPLAEALCTVTATSGAPLVVPDAATDDRVRDLPAVASGAVGSYLGVPLRDQDGHVIGALCVFGPGTRAWTGADVSLLTDLAGSAVTELELSALAVDLEATRVRWQLAVGAGGVGTFDWDLLTGVLEWDENLLRMFGYAADDFSRSIEAFDARLHPDDRPRVGRALQDSIDTVGPFEAEYRVVRPDGTTRWVRARGQALADETGRSVRLLGAAFDTTATRAEDARVARILESMSSAFFSLGRDWRFSYVNSEAERVLGRPRAELLGGDVWELFPDAVASDFETHYREVAATGLPATFEAYYPAPLDAWFEVRAWPDPDGVSVYFLDITERRRAQHALEAAHAAAAAAAERLRLIVRVSEDLSSTLDVEEAYARLAQHLVPALGDWCLVTLVDEEGQLRDLGCQHADPAAQDLVRAYREARMTALTPDSYLFRVWRTGRPVTVPEDATAALVAQLAAGSTARELITRLAPGALECLPVRARGRTVGLITLFHDDAADRLSPEDLLLATEVGDRAGLALDNARLYSAQHRVAEGLQRSLLTAPVQPDHVQVAVRYRPAARAARVGGDWYDAFLTPDGATVLVIGDVMGHDIDAAAAMSQIRSLLRGIAYTTGHSPAKVLLGLDAAMQGLDVATTATAVVARLEDTGDRTRLRWSNAGHLNPVVIGPDGTVRTLGTGSAELLLGIDPGARRSDAVVDLERGSTVLAFTDGLIERRDVSLEERLQLLGSVVTELAAQPLEDLVDGVLRLMVPGEHEDDVALLAFRLHPREGERPAEAGPERVPHVVAPPAP